MTGPRWFASLSETIQPLTPDQLVLPERETLVPIQRGQPRREFNGDDHVILNLIQPGANTPPGCGRFDRDLL